MAVPERQDGVDLAALRADPGEVQLWWGRVEPRWLERASLLDTDEEQRARRFHRERDRNRFRSRRAFLRTVLGRYLASPPAQLRFGTGPQGKPHLVGTPSAAGRSSLDLRFNLSVSEDRFVVAVAHEREVGVDVEFRRPDVELDALAERVYADVEKRAWAEHARTEGEDRARAFFRVWTRKEAVLKATGEGLSREPASFAVGFEPCVPGRVVAVGEPALPDLGLTDLEAPSGFAAALCCEGSGWRPRVLSPP